MNCSDYSITALPPPLDPQQKAIGHQLSLHKPLLLGHSRDVKGLKWEFGLGVGWGGVGGILASLRIHFQPHKHCIGHYQETTENPKAPSIPALEGQPPTSPILPPTYTWTSLKSSNTMSKVSPGSVMWQNHSGDKAHRTA